MDNNNFLNPNLCEDYVYSDEYIDFLIKYDNDLVREFQRYNTECVNIIDYQYLIAYVRLPESILDVGMVRYGYNQIQKCYGLMDITGIVYTGAERIRNLPGLSLTGRDTLIGFVDTGIDYTNSLFRNADGSTRIECIWDQNQEALGTGPTVYGYGAEYSREDINTALESDNPFSVVPSRDENGHGTFMASIAAGGIDEADNFSGMAPNSGIMVVKLKQVKKAIRDFLIIKDDVECYGEADILLGIRYLLNKASDLGLPLIICLGIGTSQGDHNGNTNLEMYLNTIANLRNVCVVSAAGNELGFGGHYSSFNTTGEETFSDQMEIYVGENDKGFSMEIWSTAPGLLKTSILSPTGEIFDSIPPLTDGYTIANFIYEGTMVFIDNTVVEKNTGDQVIFLRFQNPAQGIWTINVTSLLGGAGRVFDAWLPIYNFMNSDTSFVRPDPDTTICAPGNGRGAITVAGYNHYTNALYVDSSRGFTRDEKIKPDITAPAVNVYGALARSTGESADQPPLFIRESGTSIASAFTAGAASLIMEWANTSGNNFTANTESIKQMLIRGSRYVAEVDYPNNSWGWGVLDVYGAFEVIRNL